MSELRERFTFVVSAILYLVFNLRLGPDAMSTAKATGWQIMQTAPYLIGLTIIVVSLMQYMAGGKIMPWERRLRLFFAFGILAGLFYGIYEYAGQGSIAQ